MSHLTYTWELGGGSGHIGGFAAVAKLLDSRHHKVSFVVKDLVKAESLIGNLGFRYFQAPTRHGVSNQHRSAASYSELLLINGFDDEIELRARVKAWINLFEALSPELLIIDHSPTALVAARATAIPYVLFGTGFFAPPEVSPLPSFRTWLQISQNHLEKMDNQVLTLTNKVLKTFNAEPLHTPADLFHCAENFLCTFEELDHYPKRKNAPYWGPRFESKSGDKPAWPKKGGKKLFVYIHPYYTNIHKLLETLQAANYSVLVYCPDIPAEFISKYQNQRVSFVDHPVQVDHIAKECNLVICNSGHGLVSAMLLAGMPLLLLPIHVEQLIIARKVTELGAGLFTLPENKQPDFKKMIDALLSDSKYNQAALRFAEKYADFDLHRKNNAVVERIEEILKQT